VLAFRCARTGMLFPPDYVENWGKRYGIGLGPVPVSECLTNRYDLPIAEAKDGKQTMHPVGVCRSQVDCVDVPEEDYEAHKAVLAVDDPDMDARAQIMRDRQFAHDQKIRSMFPDKAKEIEFAEPASV
jgi:hypothetical protein